MKDKHLLEFSPARKKYSLRLRLRLFALAFLNANR